MTALDATIAVSQLLGLAISLISRAQDVSKLIAAAQQEGRDLTQAEIDQIIAAREAARQAAILASQ